MILKELDFFMQCGEGKLFDLNTTAKAKAYEAGEVMVYEEEDMNRIFFLLSGEVKFYKVDRFDTEVFLYTLKNQALLTNIGSLDCNRVSCFSNIEFLETSRVISCDLKLFKEVVKTDTGLLINLVNLLADQKQMVECTIKMGMVYDVTAKVAKILYDHLELYNSLKKQEVSYRLNIQPATLSRVLAKFIRLGLIVDDGHVTVLAKRDELPRYFQEAL